MRKRRANTLQVTSLCYVSFDKRGVRLYSTTNNKLLTFYNVGDFGCIKNTINVAKKSAYKRINHTGGK